MAEKIGVITTGGTIGSILSGDAMAVDPAGDIVRRDVDAICKAHGLDVTINAAFNKNSEDIGAADWGQLIAAVSRMIDAGLTRIVVTHGTDTLAYTAAALALVFQDHNVRICLTGSFHAPEAEASDGPLNLRAALSAVATDQLPTGIYVAFRADATNRSANIYDAATVMPMAFDAIAFSSVDNRCVAAFEQQSGLALRQQTADFDLPKVPAADFSAEALAVAARQIFQVGYYPGLCFDRIDHTRLSLLIVGLYHSGTGAAVAEQGSLLALMQQKHPELEVIAATFPSQHIDVPYLSTLGLVDAGVHVLKALPVHLVYVYAVLALASGASVGDIIAALSPWQLERAPA